MDIIRPSITKLDEQVKNTRKSQLLLAGDITKLSECMFITFILLSIYLDLKQINEEQGMPFELDKYCRKLDDSQKRVSNIAIRLQALHDRMTNLQKQIARESFKQKQQNSQSSPGS